MEISNQMIKDLKQIRHYFGENDKTQFEHLAYSVMDSLIKILTNKNQYKMKNQDQPIKEGDEVEVIQAIECSDQTIIEAGSKGIVCEPVDVNSHYVKFADDCMVVMPNKSLKPIKLRNACIPDEVKTPQDMLEYLFTINNMDENMRQAFLETIDKLHADIKYECDSYKESFENCKNKLKAGHQFTLEEIKAAKQTRDTIISDDVNELKSIYMAGEICMWDEINNV